MTRKELLSVLLMTLAPFAVFTLYLAVSRGLGHRPVIGDWTALILALGIGLLGVHLLPIRAWQRWVIALGFVPLAGVALVGFGLVFVCGTFGDCV